jgi:alkyl hydroperoxide reductase subunit AhpF
MERLLDDRVAQQVSEAFLRLSQPVRILFFGSREACDYCDETRQLLEEIAAASDRLSLEVYDLQADSAVASAYRVDKAPAVVIAADDGSQASDLGVQFSGVPSGYEFSTLINDILLVSNRDSGLSPEVREFLRDLKKPLHLQVFVTPT